MIVVITSQEIGNIWHAGSNRINEEEKKKASRLLKWLKEHDANLKPTFPNIEVESMKVYFELQTDKEISDQDIAELSRLPGIEGAYRKTAEDLPG